MSKDLPGHIRKAFRSIERYLPVVDIIVELVDARMPYGSRLRDFVKGFNKQTIVALSKHDLADDEKTKEWIKYYKKEGITCMAVDCRSRPSVRTLAKKIRELSLIPDPKRGNQARKVRRVMVIGIPNVGKSTLINSLAGRNAAKTANKPGVTRNVQWIKLSGDMELLDLPGILDFQLLRRGDLLKLINTMPGKDDDTYTKAKNLCELLTITGNENLINGYIEANSNFDLFVDGYARAMNFFIKGARPDIKRATDDIVKRFQNGGFGRVTLETPNQSIDEHAIAALLKNNEITDIEVI